MRKKYFFCILKVTGDFGTDSEAHPDPYQNITDLEHWSKCLMATHKLLSSSFIFFRPRAMPWKNYTGALQEAFSHTGRGEEG
jgi:hypothetical protein